MSTNYYVIISTTSEDSDLSTDISMVTSNLKELKELLNELFLDLVEKEEIPLDEEVLEDLYHIDWDDGTYYVYKNSEFYSIEYSDGYGYHRIISEIKPILIK